MIRPVALPELARPAPVPAADPAAPALAVREGQRIARAIVARAMEQASDIQAAAEERGLERGARLALEREAPALREIGVALGEAARRLDAARRELHGRLEGALPELAVTVAERILRRELSVRPETLVHVVREALEAIGPAPRVTLRLHPEDQAVVERHRSLIAEALGGTELRVEGSHEVERGGCVVDTDSLTLGAGLPEQLDRALALLSCTADPA